jgi:hypothetical protein
MLQGFSHANHFKDRNPAAIATATATMTAYRFVRTGSGESLTFRAQAPQQPLRNDYGYGRGELT